MDFFIAHFKNLISKSKILIKTEDDDLSKLFGDFKISDKDVEMTGESDSESFENESNTRSDSDSDSNDY